MSIDYKLIGSRMKAHRQAEHKTQEQLAEKLSVTVGYVSQLERGVTKISLDTLAEVCTILHCEMSDLITGASTGQETYLRQEFSEKYARLDGGQKKLVLDFMDLLIRQSHP